MRINKKLYKKKPTVSSEISSDSIKNVKIIPFSIIITVSSDRISELKNCFHYLNQCHGINTCEVIIVLYQNEYIDLDFSSYENIDYKIIWSKRNNPENKFCLSHARNIGLIRAKYDWTLFLDGDILVSRNLCQVLSHPEVINKPSYIYTTNRYNILSHHNLTPANQLHQFRHSIDDSFVGFFHFYNRHRIISLVGGYDESFLNWGREDCDLISRILKQGMKIHNLRRWINVFHVIHDYDSSWNDGESDIINHKLQDENIKNKKYKMTNIGNIIK